MRFDVLTLFPGVFESFLAESLFAKAISKKLVLVNLVNIRDFAPDARKTADDRPYGGGPGMVLKPEPIGLALDSLLEESETKPPVIFLSPSGKTLNQSLAKSLHENHKRLILICGRYEGVDQRVLDHYGALSLSIGDYVLNGGEVPAMVLMECVSRFVPGFLGEKESLEDDSFSQGLLECPVFTRPREYKGLGVPETLLSGNHKEIEKWRRDESLKRTESERPELLEEKSES
ncbi:MAG: tRNA (guanosine(37)-N1)-methyltransferase TrmD [Deltaproteobacteria bacterium]|jgi:tRNA (guanine37-N1)-methyltransferase|nr:tRNA (guanosine(37)-N1)-methyltransferase TrmD [Deltaproteobacteria bacterium]